MRAAPPAIDWRRRLRIHIAPMLLLLVASVSSAGCVGTLWPRRPSGPRDPGPFRKPAGVPAPIEPEVSVPPSAPSPVWRKAVAAKEPPTRLVASDGTTCAVTEERYARAAVGDVVWCVWQKATP
jgi:hypothetical protein